MSNPRALTVVTLFTAVTLMASPWAESASVSVTGDLRMFYSISPGDPSYYDSFNKSGTEGIDGTAQFSASGNILGYEEVSSFVYSSATTNALRINANGTFVRDYRFLNGENFRQLQVSGFAEMILTDLIITGPGANVTTSLNLHLSGNLGATSAPSPGHNLVTGGSSASFSVTVDGTVRGEGQYSVSSVAGVTQTSSANGWLQDFDGSTDLTTSTFNLQTGTALTVRLALGISVTGLLMDTDQGTVGGFADFGNTASFNFDGPVFNLPEGYTANSVSGGIVNNRFVLVPEPGPALLVAATALPLLSWRRRREPSQS